MKARQQAGLATIAVAAIAGALTLMGGSQAQAKPAGCPAQAVSSSPGDRMQTVTVKDHAAMDVYVRWQTVKLVSQCGQLVAMNLSGGPPDQVNSGSKTLTAGFSWSTTYDTATQAVYMTAYTDKSKGNYCWENQEMDRSKGSITLTVTGSLITKQSCDIS